MFFLIGFYAKEVEYQMDDEGFVGTVFMVVHHSFFEEPAESFFLSGLRVVSVAFA